MYYIKCLNEILFVLMSMLETLKKKTGIKLKYKVRSNKKTKLSNKKQKNTWSAITCTCIHVWFSPRCCHRQLKYFTDRDASMAYILFIGYMRLSTHLVLRILSNPRIYIVVLLYKSLSNPNISIGLCRLFFFSLTSW
jgi:hypothetical protein